MSTEKSFKIDKVEKLPDSEIQITGEISSTFLNHCRKEALKRFNEIISLPGFRKGFIPEDILIKNVGEKGILEESAEIALSQQYVEVIKEAEVKPIIRPEIKILNMAPNVPLNFQINVVTEPEFSLADYKKYTEGISEEDMEKRRMKILENILKETKIELPKKFVESEASHTLHHFKHDVEKAGIVWKEYLEKANKTEEEIKEAFKEQVVSRAKSELIINKIAEKEKLKTYAEVFAFLEKPLV